MTTYSPRKNGPSPADELGSRKYRAACGVEPARPGWLRKHVACDPVEEVAKAEGMHAALIGTSFVAPRAEIGDRPETILVEDLGPLTPLTELLERAVSFEELREPVAAAAQILAVLHSRLGLQVDTDFFKTRIQPARRPFRGPTLLHGDFCPMNVFRDVSGHYVTLDGSPNSTACLSPLTVGGRVADLASFTLVMCWPLRPLHWRVSQARLRLAARRHFLVSYWNATGRRPRWHLPFEMALLVQELWFRKLLRRK